MTYLVRISDLYDDNVISPTEFKTLKEAEEFKKGQEEEFRKRGFKDIKVFIEETVKEVQHSYGTTK